MNKDISQEDVFVKIPADKLLEEYKSAIKKHQKPKPYDLTDEEGKVFVSLRQLPLTHFVNKLKLMEKLKQIVGTLSYGTRKEIEEIEPGRISTQLEMEKDKSHIERKKKKAENLKKFLSSISEEETKEKPVEELPAAEKVVEEKEEVIEGSEEEKELELEKPEVSTEKFEEEKEKPEEQIMASEEKELEEVKLEEAESAPAQPQEIQSSLHPVLEEMVKDSISQEYNQLIIEDKETYSKVKQGVGISYIDNHKFPELVSPCPEFDVDKRSQEIVSEIQENFTSSKKVSKAELSKRLVELTRLFLKAKTREERNKIRSEIVEIKHALKSKEERKKINPLSMLKERQLSSLSKIIDDFYSLYSSEIEKVKSSYDEAISLNPSGNLRDKINEFKEKDISLIKSKLEEEIENCKSKLMELHLKEVALLSEKVKLKDKEVEGYKEEISEIYRDRFDSLKQKILSLIENTFKSEEPSSSFQSNVSVEQEVEKEEVPQQVSPIEDIKKDLQSLGDANWLHYLGKANRRLFWKYVRGEMNKEEAIKKSKELYIKEKAKSFGLSDSDTQELMKLI